MRAENEPLRILIVEDNRADAFLISMVLKDLGMRLTIDVARDGQAALDILARASTDPAVPAPDMVILDLNLPRVNGYEVLSFIRSGPLRSVPVVVMTGSLNKEDEARSLRMGANFYLSKPSTLADIDATSAFFRMQLDRRSRREEGRENGASASVALKARTEGLAGLHAMDRREPSRSH